MEEKFTLNTILSKAYQEVSAASEDDEFIRKAKPHRHVVQTIMNYSKSLSVYQTQSAGRVRVNSN